VMLCQRYHSPENQPTFCLFMPSAMFTTPSTCSRVFSRANLRSFLASLRAALIARLLSFRSGVRFATTNEQHFRVLADCAKLAPGNPFPTLVPTPASP
jgi:hypothetical protein